MIIHQSEEWILRGKGTPSPVLLFQVTSCTALLDVRNAGKSRGLKEMLTYFTSFAAILNGTDRMEQMSQIKLFFPVFAMRQVYIKNNNNNKTWSS